MHRAQLLFRERRYSDSEELIKGWKPVSDSEYESAVASNLRIESDKIAIAREHMDDAVTHLRAVAESGQDRGAGMKQTDVNWATVLLCQVYCWQSNYEQVRLDLQPRIQRLLDGGAHADYITSDFRILLCEALLGLQRFHDAGEQIETLCTDLLHPTQIKNTRASSQLFQALCLKARCFQLQQQWQEASSCWTDALKHEQITEQMIHEGDIKSESYWVLLATYSLGLVYCYLGDGERGQQYVSFAKERLSRFAGHGDPGEILDYTKWQDRMEDADGALRKSSSWGQTIKRYLSVGRSPESRTSKSPRRR